MKDTRLSELIEDEQQRLVFVFDPLAERMLFIELTEILFGQSQPTAICSRQHGDAPQQVLDMDELLKGENGKSNEDIQENFYGSDEFDKDEFDPEGFQINDGNTY